jgi:hypothetical protein
MAEMAEIHYWRRHTGKGAATISTVRMQENIRSFSAQYMCGLPCSILLAISMQTMTDERQKGFDEAGACCASCRHVKGSFLKDCLCMRFSTKSAAQ